MKRQIKTREDIEMLVDAFYTKVKKDEVIGYIFTEVVALSWETHMPTMYNFWETVLLGKMSYKGNPIAKHIELNDKTQLTETHFRRWKKLFFETLDEHFEGEKVEEAKKKVDAIVLLMKYKIEKSKDQGFIQ